MTPCCDLHGRNCEPPSELCCWSCAEAAHRMGDAATGVHLADGSRCSNPDLSHTAVSEYGLHLAAQIDQAVAAALNGLEG